MLFSLEKAGFGKESATHLEYQEARRLGKPVLVLVRDRLFADFKVWQKDEKAKLYWIKDSRDYPLLTWLGEIEPLSIGDQPNWLVVFRDSVEIKQILKSQLRLSSGVALARHLWEKRELPWFDVQLTQTTEQGEIAFDLNVHLQNDTTLHSVAVQLSHSDIELGRISGSLGLPKMIVAQKVKQKYRITGDYAGITALRIKVQYVTEYGYAVTEEYLPTPAQLDAGGAILVRVTSRVVTGSPET